MSLSKVLSVRAATLSIVAGFWLLVHPGISTGTSPNVAIAQATTLTDDQIRDAMIRESISVYPGNCPCPYNLARNRSRCGGRSAYSRPGGHAPLCYRQDISDEMVKAYRAGRRAR